ncbi:glycosyltransferase family 2 protein [Oryzihumus leptocrescens]|uniref:Uncharacterized protein n=1 Tax=Oryzihumus leptocrescens TaxID=297536 RepID=A0A542ZI24_9MICO|nr:glycosyltransferase family 2 protein [Oryzihumus leptocrescens]TQL59982.1 hypothetical protein FB474_1357 [Oryzihumus leptocrescens]
MIQAAPTLQVQSVLYGNDKAHVTRFIEALSRSIELARSAGVLGDTHVSFGDCSPVAVFSDHEIGDLLARHKRFGLDAISYEFFDQNKGSAAGHNHLLRGLTADYVLIVNPDTIPAPDLLIEMLKPFSEQVRVGAVEARQLPLEHPKPYDPKTGETPWITTACALTTREVAAAVEGFDAETFFLYCDDVDWSWRVRLAGYRLILRDSARIFHDKRLGTDGSWQVGAAEEYYSAEAALLMAYKWSRPELVEKYSRDLRLMGSELQRKAVDAFERRREDGRLPAQLDPDRAVSEFVDGVYAKHRF